MLQQKLFSLELWISLERNLGVFGYVLMISFQLLTVMASESLNAIDPDIPDSEKYQMPLRMTYGDRRVLAAKADAAGVSPTKWLVSRINEAFPQQKRNLASKPTGEELSITLDRQRREIANVVAGQLGFVSVEDMAKDLMHQALNDPEMAEQFLFGKLRKRLQQEAREELQQSTKSKAA